MVLIRQQVYICSSHPASFQSCRAPSPLSHNAPQGVCLRPHSSNEKKEKKRKVKGHNLTFRRQSVMLVLWPWTVPSHLAKLPCSRVSAIPLNHGLHPGYLEEAYLGLYYNWSRWLGCPNES